MRVKFYDIEWDTDGEPTDLPRVVVLDVPDDTNIWEDGADLLSDQYGFCISSLKAARDFQTCQRCNSERILVVSGKTSDLCWASIHSHEHDGYVPGDIGLSGTDEEQAINGGDYLAFDLCLACGQVQGTWPLPESKLERGEKYE